MVYLLFGFALGTLIYWFIARFDKKHAAWINPSYILWLSVFFFLLFIYTAWPILKRIFS